MKNLQVYTLFFVIKIKKFYIIYPSIVIALKCADCMCNIKDCKLSQSPFECPNCILDKCCCWENFHFSDDNNNFI
jgi:hypothetical protein